MKMKNHITDKRIFGKLQTCCALALMFPMLAAMTSCSKGKSYSELLKEEEKAVNWFLAGQRVETKIPKDSVFKVGKDAPFYRMDEDGYLYMQVVEMGDTSDMAQTGDEIYFTYLRRNIKMMYEGIDVVPEGNANDMTGGVNAPSFIYGNYELANSSAFGTGIQTPLQFLGNNSEVNLVLRSYYGFMADQSECIPYIINIKYFKVEY